MLSTRRLLTAAALAPIVVTTCATAASPRVPTLLAKSHVHVATSAAAGPAGAPWLTAKGVINIRVSGPARFSLRIPKPVSVPRECLSWSTPGTGLVGMLVPVAGTPGTPLPFGVLPPELGGRAYGLGCTAPDVLPAGAYNVYVADVHRAGVLQLRLPGLSGAMTVHPSKRISSHLRLLPDLTPATKGVATSWGATSALAGRGLTFTTVWLRASAGTSTLIGDCVYKGAPPPLVAYAPGCPAADYSSAAPYDAHVQVAEDWLASTTANLPAGTYGVGAYAAGGNVAPTGAALAWWLTY